MQDEAIWDLLLGQLWQPLDQQVVLKLLCCSKTLMELVHSKCAGTLPVTVSAVHDSSCPPAVLTSWPQHQALGRWLAKHARLCSSINFTATQHELPKGNPLAVQHASAASNVEVSVAAGLSVAATGRSSIPQPRITRQQTDIAPKLYPATDGEVAVAVAAAVAAALASRSSSSSSSSSSRRGSEALLLTQFVSSMPSTGKILPALTSFKALTRLELQLGGKKSAGVAAKAALARLKGLKELAFKAEHGSCVYRAHAWHHAVLDSLAPALPLLTRLTRLKLGWVPAEYIVQQLPVSLEFLSMGMHEVYGLVSGLAHLTRVTELHVPHMSDEVSLPPMLHTLSGLASIEQLVNLQHLRQVLPPSQGCVPDEFMQNLHKLTQVTQFSLLCRHAGLLARRNFVRAPDMPLKRLILHRYGYWPLTAEVVEVIGSCKQLTCLKLAHVCLDVPVTALVAQLKSLPSLCELAVAFVEGRSNGRSTSPLVWDALWRAVPHLVSLRSFVAHGLRLEDGVAVTGLAAATQLSYCELLECDVSEAAEAELRAGLTQLMPNKLVVGGLFRG